ncbi:MAG: hypothetical protein JWQ90_5600 [Hydrocarboniphaga sp.]|uniref:hypothetical protein n=1 Tax=Hydrocarboniphaga sp. TaxID=2033016 RepID=UPI00261B9AEC|nr:hypothetical protein [Hydrocarboniphaga sp.]MDB5973150.1 hypothetical protein [Hydrocarboniphaga sp.]
MAADPAGRSAKPNTDFSAQAVSRAVLGRSLSQPHVLYPAAVGILGGLAAAVLGPSMIFVAPAAIGAVIGLGGWALDFTMRRDKHAADYLKRLQEALAGRADETMARLRGEFAEVSFEPGQAQLDAFKEKYQAFEGLLRRKLDPKEMTFSRFLGMTEQVFLAGLDNLTRISDALKGLSAIDVQHIARRLQHLETDGIESEAQDREIATLKERMSLLERQRNRIDGWLAENEIAMTQIDQAMAAIGEMDTSQGHAAMDIDAAMAELRTIASRAQKIGKTI